MIKINSKTIKLVSVIAASVLVCTGAGAMTYAATQKNDDTVGTTTNTEVKTTDAKKDITKDETVYVIANSDGSVKKVIVSDWIKNTMGAKKIADKTDLTDIKNVKGNESYVMDENSMKVWNAESKDIYCQGTISKELPVDLSVTYKLDGKTISAEDLAGKSGKVTIRFDYKNNQYSYVNIDGKKEKINVPFVMLTGMLLNDDSFTNVEVSNGKVINDGSHLAVVGFALPGFQENLAISKEKIDIPDYVEINADVKKFELGTSMTLATNNIFNELDTSKLNTVDDLQKSLNKLTTAMTQLLDGSSDLYNGLSSLLSKSGELIKGIDSLAAGANKLSAGSKSLSDGLEKLISNNDDLNNGATTVFQTLLGTVSAQLNENKITTEKLTITNYKTVLNDLIENPTDAQKGQLIAIANPLIDASLKANNVPEAYFPAVKVMLFERMSKGMSQEKAMAEIGAILAGPDAATAIGTAMADPKKDIYINALCVSLAQQTLKPTVEGAITQLDSYNKFYQGVLKYTAGAKEAYEGSKELNQGVSSLKDGIGVMKDSGGLLVGGVQQLTDGSKKLADGLKDFDNQGVKRLTSLAQGELSGLVTRVKATVDVSKSYKSFAGIDENANGSVKFIYKTDEIKIK